MASLALAATIGGAGRGITDTVKMQNENKQRDLDREHRERLQQMADEAAMDRTNRRGTIQNEYYAQQRVDQMLDRADERDYNAQIAAGATSAAVAEREDKQAHEAEQGRLDRENDYNMKLLDMYDQYSKDSSVTTKDGKWEMKVLTKGEIGPNGLPVETDTFVIREPGTPFSYVQHGMHMLPHNYTPEEAQATLNAANNLDADAKIDVEILLNRAGKDNDVSSEFLRVYGFLPVEYFRKVKSTASKKSFSEFKKTFSDVPERQGSTLSQARAALTEARPTSLTPVSLQPKSVDR